MRQKLLYLLACTLLIVPLACQKNGPDGSHAGDAIDIGIICPLTGVNASAGEDLKAGALLALDLINTAVDLPIPLARGEGLPNHGHAKIRAVIKDTRGDPSLAVRLVEELHTEHRVTAILGEYSSTVTAAASERAEVMNMPFLNAASTSPTLTQRGLRWFFRTTPDDQMFAENFFLFLADQRQRAKADWPKRVILLYENKLWGTSVARAERKLAAQFGYEVVDEVTYDATQEDFSAELDRIRAGLPAVLLQASYDRDAVALVHGCMERRIEPLAILGMNAGFISPGFLASLGDEAESVMSREVWSLDIGERKPLIQSVNRLFHKRFGRDMTGNSARSFTTTIVLADALNRASSLDSNAVREALLATDLAGEALIMPWEGVRFDEKSGQNILGKGIIVQAQQGQYRTVWPWDLATRPVIWPPATRAVP